MEEKEVSVAFVSLSLRLPRTSKPPMVPRFPKKHDLADSVAPSRLQKRRRETRERKTHK